MLPVPPDLLKPIWTPFWPRATAGRKHRGSTVPQGAPGDAPTKTRSRFPRRPSRRPLEASPRRPLDVPGVPSTLSLSGHQEPWRRPLDLVVVGASTLVCLDARSSLNSKFLGVYGKEAQPWCYSVVPVLHTISEMERKWHVRNSHRPVVRT